MTILERGFKYIHMCGCSQNEYFHEVFIDKFRTDKRLFIINIRRCLWNLQHSICEQQCER